MDEGPPVLALTVPENTASLEEQFQRYYLAG